MAEIPASEFLQPTATERIFNRVFGWIVAAGLSSRHNYLLEVVGRKSGRRYTTPVHLLVIGGRSFLVCPRGRSQWVRNAEASGKVWLKRGGDRVEYALRAVLDADRSELLRAYLDRFKLTVQRYFPLPAGSPASAFTPIADRYPVFQLVLADRIADPSPDRIADPQPSSVNWSHSHISSPSNARTARQSWYNNLGGRVRVVPVLPRLAASRICRLRWRAREPIPMLGWRC